MYKNRSINASDIFPTILTNPAEKSLICHLLTDEHRELRPEHRILLQKTFSSAAKSPGKHFVKQLHSAGTLCDNIGNSRICSGFSKSIYLSMLRNINSSTAIHADDQLKTQEQVFHISLQQYVKHRCSQALALKQYLSLNLYINYPIYFWRTFIPNPCTFIITAFISSICRATNQYLFSSAQVPLLSPPPSPPFF